MFPVLLPVSFQWKLPVSMAGKSFFIWTGPSPAIPFIGRNVIFFSFSFVPPFFLKPEGYHQSSKSSGIGLGKSQMPTAGTDPRSCAHAFFPGTQAENVFSRNVSLGVESLKMSV